MTIRDSILASDDLPREPVSAWGQSFFLRAMTGAERTQYDFAMFSGDGEERAMDTANIRARMIAFCSVDADGVRIFTDDDVEALAKKNGATLQRLAVIAMRLNEMSAGTAEATEKKSEPSQSAPIGA